MRRIAALGTVALLSGGLATGIHLAETPSTTTPSAPEASAVAALVTMPPRAARRHMPADFTRFNDYRPQISRGHLVNPQGGCSSPIPLPAEFDPICRQHDLGYDLLRTAQATGGTLPATARRDLDHQFAVETHHVCRERTGAFARAECGAWADIATAAIEANSWRQHWSSPTESPASISAIVAAVLCVLCGAAALVGATSALLSRARRLALPRLPQGVRA